MNTTQNENDSRPRKHARIRLCSVNVYVVYILRIAIGLVLACSGMLTGTKYQTSRAHRRMCVCVCVSVCVCVCVQLSHFDTKLAPVRPPQAAKGARQ